MSETNIAVREPSGDVRIDLSKVTVEDRQDFWLHVARDVNSDRCWYWTGSRAQRVPQFNIRRCGWVPAQVLAYTIQQGEIPAGYWLLTNCSNEDCMNPAHMVATTPRTRAADLLRDAIDPERCKRLVADKLDLVQVQEILYLSQATVPRNVLAREYGTSETMIDKIIDGDSWVGAGPAPDVTPRMAALVTKHGKGWKRLSTAKVSQMKLLFARGLGTKAAARHFGIDKAAASRIRNGRTHANVPPAAALDEENRAAISG